MHAAADVPIVQLNLDVTTSPRGHFDTDRALAPLRREGVQIGGGDYMVRNLVRVVLTAASVSRSDTATTPPWLGR